MTKSGRGTRIWLGSLAVFAGLWLLVAFWLAMLAQPVPTLLAAAVALGNVYTWRRWRDVPGPEMKALAIACTLLDVALVMSVLGVLMLWHMLAHAEWGAIR